MNGLQRRTVRFEVKSQADGPGGDKPVVTFDGLAGAFYNLDFGGDILDDTFFDDTLEFTKSQGKIRDEHGITVGRIVDASIATKAGLNVSSEVYDTTSGRDLAVLIRTKTVNDLSIGYRVSQREWLSVEGVMGYWSEKSYTPTDEDMANLAYWGGARLLKKGRVYEVSATWLGMNSRTKITSVKSGSQASPFDAHASRALAAVGDFLERAESVTKLRAEFGRTLSPERKAALTALQDRLTKLQSSLETKAAETVPEPVDGSQLFNQFLAIDARINGIL